VSKIISHTFISLAKKAKTKPETTVGKNSLNRQKQVV
jgi:hypothetical protein